MCNESYHLYIYNNDCKMTDNEVTIDLDSYFSIVLTHSIFHDRSMAPLI